MRIFLQYLLPFLLPLAVFLIYAWWANRRVEKGNEVTLAGNWYWIVISGFVLLFAGLLTWNTIQGADPGATYVPPKLVDGEVVPGHFITEEE